MAKLKLGLIADDKPVKVTLELPATLHRDLSAYAEILGRETGQPGGRSGPPDRSDAQAVHSHGSGIYKSEELRIIAEIVWMIVAPADRDIERARLWSRRDAGLSLCGDHTVQKWQNLTNDRR